MPAITTDLFTNKKYVGDGTTSDFIYQIAEENFKYKQHDFNWEKWLKTHSQITSDENGNLYFADPAAQPKKVPEKNIEFLKSNVHGYKPYSK